MAVQIQNIANGCKPREAWGLLWRSINQLDGETRRIMFDGLLPIAFRTRREARAHIKQYYSYIAKRPDLTSEPHGWRMPIAVRISVLVKQI